MNETLVSMPLDAAERRLINTLRDLPESRLRDRVQRLLDELVLFLKFPRCQWMQADGVPCGAVDRDCDHCQHLTELIDHLAARLPEG